MTEPVVSILCLTYNHVHYIKDALDSFLMQKTNFPYEICLGEDESSDGTRKICQEYAKKYPDKIRLFLRSRKDVIYINGLVTGKYNSIETFKECKGKYIAYCDGDDYWTDPYKLQEQVDYLEKNIDFGMVHTDCDIINEINKKINKKAKENKNIPHGNVKNQIIIKNFIHTSTTLIKRDAVNFAMNLFDYTKYNAGDYILWNATSQQYKIAYINKSTAVIRHLNKSVSNPITLDKMMQFDQAVFKIRFDFLNKYYYPNKIKEKILYNYNILYLIYGILANDKTLLSSLKYNVCHLSYIHRAFLTLMKVKPVNIIIFFIIEKFLSKNRFIRYYIKKHTKSY